MPKNFPKAQSRHRGRLEYLNPVKDEIQAIRAARGLIQEKNLQRKVIGILKVILMIVLGASLGCIGFYVNPVGAMVIGVVSLVGLVLLSAAQEQMKN